MRIIIIFLLLFNTIKSIGQINAEYDIVQHSAEGANDGKVTITTTGSVAETFFLVKHHDDDSENVVQSVQFDPGKNQHTFQGIAPGTYHGYVANGYEFDNTEVFRIEIKAISAEYNIVQHSTEGANDGKVTIMANGSVAETFFLVKHYDDYSENVVQSAQFDPGKNEYTFEGVAPGTYHGYIENGDKSDNTETFDIEIKDEGASERRNITEKPKVINYQDLSMNIFPNPTDGILNLNIKTPESNPAIIEIYNLKGGLVYKNSTYVLKGDYRRQIQLPNDASAGTYIVNVRVGEYTATQKVVLIK